MVSTGMRMVRTASRALRVARPERDPVRAGLIKRNTISADYNYALAA